MQKLDFLHSAFHSVNNRPNSSFNPTKKRLPSTLLWGAWPTAIQSRKSIAQCRGWVS